MKRLDTDGAMVTCMYSRAGNEPYRGTLAAFDDYDSQVMAGRVTINARQWHARQAPVVTDARHKRVRDDDAARWDKALAAATDALGRYAGVSHATMAERPLGLDKEPKWTAYRWRESDGRAPLYVNGVLVAQAPGYQSGNSGSGDAARMRRNRLAAIVLIPEAVYRQQRAGAAEIAESRLA